MCGINAIYAYRSAAPPVDRDELLRTREAMHTRGPDAGGEWLSADGRVGLGHRRLSIIDVSERANQPMHSREGDMSIVFNGEIYNYRELAAELDGETLATTSDTEVLLRMYRRWGAAMLPRLRGMFAFAIWDAREKTMFLARDPYGIKPLYIADDGRTIRVASQVKALLAGGAVSREHDPAGIAGFFLRGSMPEPYTMYAAIREVPAGSSIAITPRGASKPRSYFSIAAALKDAVAHRRHYDDEERAAVIRDAVTQSVRYHLVSDVPVGAFLSSGRDSSTIVALAAENGGGPLETVTLRFDEYVGTPKDEAPLAELVAREYGTRHSTWTLTGDAFRRELPRALDAMDQPSIDGLNSYFVSKAAADLGWKVALSGTGGDELFGGYTTFRVIPRFVRTFSMFRHMPTAAKSFEKMYKQMFGGRQPRFSPKTAHTLKYCTTYEGAYLMKRGLFLPEELPELLGDELAREGLHRLGILEHIRDVITPDPGTPFARVAALETALFMRNQLLRDIDWASMAHSLEVRVPLVDAFLLRAVAPAVFSTAKRDGKTLLARSPRKPLPEPIMTRRKTGFTLPIRDWLAVERHDIARLFGMRPWALYLYEHNLAA